MEYDKKQLFRHIYGVALALMTIVVGVLFILQVTDIYFTGKLPSHEGDIYSREIVAAHLQRIVIPIVLWLVMVVAGNWLSSDLSFGGHKKNFVYPTATLTRLKKRLPDELSMEEVKPLLKREVIRWIPFIVAAVVTIVCGVFCALYVTDRAHFPGINVIEDAKNMTLYLLPFLAVAFVFCVAAVAVNEFLAQREVSIVRDLLKKKAAPSKKEGKNEETKAKKYALLGCRITLGTVAVTFIVLGVLNGGMADVLIKAIKICTECIGLG